MNLILKPSGVLNVFFSNSFRSNARGVENCNWANIINGSETFESATENFTSKFLSYIRECIPEKIITVRPRDKPWFDSLLRKSIRIRGRLRNKALKTRNESDWSAYKKIRNSINNMKKHAISNYYDSIDTYLDDSSKDNNKLYWKLMKESFNIKLSNEIPQYKLTVIMVLIP